MVLQVPTQKNGKTLAVIVMLLALNLHIYNRNKYALIVQFNTNSYSFISKWV